MHFNFGLSLILYFCRRQVKRMSGKCRMAVCITLFSWFGTMLLDVVWICANETFPFVVYYLYSTHNARILLQPSVPASACRIKNKIRIISLSICFFEIKPFNVFHIKVELFHSSFDLWRHSPNIIINQIYVIDCCSQFELASGCCCRCWWPCIRKQMETKLATIQRINSSILRQSDSWNLINHA